MECTRATLIKGRLAYIRRQLDTVLDKLTPDLLEWAPAAGMRTVSGQLVEIIGVELPLVAQLRDGKQISDADTDAIIGDAGSLDNLRIVLNSVHRETLDYLDSLSDGDLAEEVSYGGIWFGSFWQPQMPRAELFLNVAGNEYYHVGQLISYLWARGNDPYQWR